MSFEDTLAWARSLDTSHDCVWREEVRGNTGYDPIVDVCVICDREKPTMLMRRWY